MKPQEAVVRTLLAGGVAISDVLFMWVLAVFVSGGGHGVPEVGELLGRNLGRLLLLSTGLGALAYARQARFALAATILYLTLWPLAAYLPLSAEDGIMFDDAYRSHPQLVGFWMGGVIVARVVVMGLCLLFIKSREQADNDGQED